MSKSGQPRADDWRAILQLVGECRDPGDDRTAWRTHLLDGLARLVDAEAGECGESGIREGRQASLDVVHRGHEGRASPADLAELYATLERDPMLYGLLYEYFARQAREDGVCHSRREIIDDGRWYRSTDYQLVHRTLGMDHVLWCFRSLHGRTGREFSGVMLYREAGRRDFSPRDRAIVREAHAALAPMIGGTLARFDDPSPLDLAPRARRVLACLLQGDTDKQVAARLRLSVHTVNEYIKAIFRHFRVRSRPERLARWVRRGWQAPPPWAE
jgi:DNA-binding CsgD family transcriptional regulator